MLQEALRGAGAQKTGKSTAAASRPSTSCDQWREGDRPAKACAPPREMSPMMMWNMPCRYCCPWQAPRGSWSLRHLPWQGLSGQVPLFPPYFCTSGRRNRKNCRHGCSMPCGSGRPDLPSTQLQCYNQAPFDNCIILCYTIEKVGHI